MDFEFFKFFFNVLHFWKSFEYTYCRKFIFYIFHKLKTDLLEDIKRFGTNSSKLAFHKKLYIFYNEGVTVPDGKEDGCASTAPLRNFEHFGRISLMTLESKQQQNRKHLISRRNEYDNKLVYPLFRPNFYINLCVGFLSIYYLWAGSSNLPKILRNEQKRMNANFVDRNLSVYLFIRYCIRLSCSTGYTKVFHFQCRWEIRSA